MVVTSCKRIDTMPINEANTRIAIKVYRANILTTQKMAQHTTSQDCVNQLFVNLAKGKHTDLSNTVIVNTANELCIINTVEGWRDYLTDSAAEYRSAEVEKYAKRFPDETQWLIDNKDKNSFAASLYNSIVRYGALTANQLAAVQKNLTAKVPAADAPAPVQLHTESLMQAFDKAKANKVQYPKMRFEGFVISPASLTGKNAGALYVKSDEGEGVYLGKVVGGIFHPTRECNEATVNKVHAILKDPLKEAVAYGKRVGVCSICGRRLDNKESIDRGIGPICAEKFGFLGMPSEITPTKQVKNENVTISPPKVPHVTAPIETPKPKGVSINSRGKKDAVNITANTPVETGPLPKAAMGVISDTIIYANLKVSDKSRAEAFVIKALRDNIYQQNMYWAREVKLYGLAKTVSVLQDSVRHLITAWVAKHGTETELRNLPWVKSGRGKYDKASLAEEFDRLDIASGKEWSSETYLVLRNCNIRDIGELEGVKFVRCIPRCTYYNEFGDGWKMPKGEARAIAARVVKDVGEDGICVAFNDKYGGDYVRVNTNTATFRRICHMQS